MFKACVQAPPFIECGEGPPLRMLTMAQLPARLFGGLLRTVFS